MDALAIVGLAAKGISLIETLMSAGQSIVPAVVALKKTFGDGSKVPTEQDIEVCEQTLDSLLDKFMEPLPPKPGV